MVRAVQLAHLCTERRETRAAAAASAHRHKGPLVCRSVLTRSGCRADIPLKADCDLTNIGKADGIKNTSVSNDATRYT